MYSGPLDHRGAGPCHTSFVRGATMRAHDTPEVDLPVCTLRGHDSALTFYPRSSIHSCHSTDEQEPYIKSGETRFRLEEEVEYLVLPLVSVWERIGEIEENAKTARWWR